MRALRLLSAQDKLMLRNLIIVFPFPLGEGQGEGDSLPAEIAEPVPSLGEEARSSFAPRNDMMGGAYLPTELLQTLIHF